VQIQYGAQQLSGANFCFAINGGVAKRNSHAEMIFGNALFSISQIYKVKADLFKNCF